ncbi:isopeptide-forming domain-containing fimbrial protein [Oligosphaera ethanolica]|uniref:Repeat protein (TIGR01451 family)/fimbrial isopeptide formation D2 family protein n=1 Tax=Oligosphaera ethanolica TaxID=760260 RepID=A0AAE3VF83_9BACT|nr:isopeptide-forming domain-containing fimbrial protein [Oligosphaera ethanolica]MDQ0289413.1 putative repeat protein (TIGR01451 family)/fimbrial isopeptide formation D2 family protein [Oligosphaera ethanolica]
MMNNRISIWTFVLLTMALPLFGALRINEVMFDPGAGEDPDAEFIELYNEGPGDVDLLNWSLDVNGLPLKTFDVSLILPAGQYLAVFMGSPAAPPPSSYLLGLASEVLGDNGGEILLRDDTSTPHDYIAYGTVVATPPAPLVFPLPISLAYWQSGDSIAFIQPDGTTNDDPSQWLNRRGANVTPAATNNRQPAPVVSYGSITVPAAFPSVNSCEEIEVPVTVSYSHEAPVFNAVVTSTLPAGFLFVSASAGGVFDDATRSVSWSLDTLDADAAVSVRVRPNCSVTTGQFTSAALALSFCRYPSQVPPVMVNSANVIASFDVNVPELNVAMSQYNTGAKVIIANVGSVVEFQIEVTNTGTGTLPGDGAFMTLTLAANLSLIGFRQNGPLGPPVEDLALDVVNGIFTGSTGAIAPAQTRMFYVKALSVGCATVFNCAKIELNWTCADNPPGTQSCSVDVDSGASVFCPPTLTFEVPVGAPAVYMGCQDVVRNIVVSNPNGVPLEITSLDVNLPSGYYWVSTSIGATAVGTYDQAGKSLSFTAAEISGGTGTIGAYGMISIELVMRPSCTATTDRKSTGVFVYEIECPLSGPLLASVSAEGNGITLRQPALAVAVQDPANPSKTTVLAERGEIVTFKVVVVNNGLGDLDTDGKAPGEEGGWLELLSVGSGLSMQSVRDITLGEPGVEVTPAGAPARWPTGVMGAGSDRTYLVDFLVQDCVDVSYDIGTYWTCAGADPLDNCQQDGESKGSVSIVLRNPSLSIAPTPFVVNYCTGATVSVPVSNADDDGIGAARNVSVALMGLNLAHYDIAMDPGSPFAVSIAGNVATFSLVDGDDADNDGGKDDIGRGHTCNIDFTVNIKDGVCSAATDGTLVYQPYYEDSCGIPYTAGTQLSSYSRTDRVGVAFTKAGPTIARVGDNGLVWTVSFSYTGQPGASFEYTLTDNYPDASNDLFGSFTIVSFADGGGSLTPGVDYTDDGDRITRSVTTVFDGDGNFSETFTIVFDAPDTVCAGGRTYTNSANVVINTPAAPVDCNDCTLPTTLSSASSITLNNRVEDDIDQHNRRVTYNNINIHGLDNSAYQGAGETCSTMVFDQILRFTPASPGAWAVDVDPGPDVSMRSVRFRDALNERLRAPNGVKKDLNVQIYYFAAPWEPAVPAGTDYGPNGTGLVDWNAVSYVAPTGAADGLLEIDLGGLDAIPGGAPSVPADGGILWIRYTLQAQSESVGTFTDFALVTVPLPGGDPCSLGQPETEYYHLAFVSIANSVPTVSISNVSSPNPLHIDRCETLTLRFNLGAEDSRPFDVYDARLVVDLGGNYRYLPGTTSFGAALLDEGGLSITSFEPIEAGNTLTWNFGDIRGLSGAGNRYVDITVQKSCDQASTWVGATISGNNQCNQIDDANGPGAANSQDAAIAAIVDFDDGDSTSYEPLLYSGRLETRFASQRVFYNDAYPTALLHIVNSGNGTLYNARIPVELGSLHNGTGSLTFLEAHVTAVSGSTSATVDTVNPIIPVAFGPEYAHGYRQITFAVDWMAPSSIVTIRLRLRMVLCADLSLKIVQAHWGCPSGPADACPENLDAPELNSSMEIRSGTARLLVIEHQSSPSIVDLCGSKMRIAIDVLNAGSVDVYEPIIRERFPEGLQIIPDSVHYSINGGALTPFPEISAAGLRYSEMNSTVTGIGTYQTIFWNFTDPDNDGDEADSLLPSPAFDDPFATDPLFNRHVVMKPTTRLRIEFDAELDGCANALAYQNSSRRAEATLLFDLPCHHDDRVGINGEPIVGPGRLPLDDTTRESTFLDPGEANVSVRVSGQNITQGAPVDFGQVNAELNDAVEWTVQLDALGPGVVPDPILELFVPAILSVDFATAPPVISSPANIVFVDSNPAGVPQANPAGMTYTFVFRNTDPAMIAANREYYFSATEKVTIAVPTQLNTCIDEKPTFEALLRWGCCLGTPGLEAASGQDQASLPIKSKADPPSISVVEGDGALIAEFDSCLGAYTIILTSPTTNRELSLRQLDVTMTLPNGWTYAPLVGDGTDFIYAGTGARQAADQLLPAEEEPVIVGDVLRWTSVSRGGNIPDDRAKLFPQEQLRIVVYLRADGSGVNCDLDGENNPSVPSFTQSVTFANYEDSCGGSLDSPKGASVAINPENPSLNILLVPSTRFIGSGSTDVQWELRIQNTGDKAAADIVLELDFGLGYSSVSHTGGAPAPAQVGNAFNWPIGSILSLPPAETLVWTFTASIDTVTRGDLAAQAAVRGYCRERDASLGCTYAFAETEQFVSGASIVKTLDGTRLQMPAVSTTPGPNDPAATAANASVGTILRNVIRVQIYEGGETDIIVRDVLPSGLVFLEANLVDSAGDWLANLVPTSSSNNIITFSHSSIGQFDNIVGGRIGADAFFLEIWSRVDDDTAVVTDGVVLTNTAQLTVIRGNQVFDHTTPDLALFSANEVTILEPFIRNDASLTKISDPPSLPANHVGAPLDIEPRPGGDNPVAYTFTAINTGSSPAYELEFTDLFPWQFEDPTALASPYGVIVSITPEAGPPARNLIKDTDYALSWVAGVSPNPGTLTVNLLPTADATLGVNETITIAYHGKVETFAPGTFVDNSGDVTGYSSLPAAGATLITARGTSLAENDDERTSYGGIYRNLPVKRTYHKFTNELIASGAIIAEITPMADGNPPALRDDGSTRATIGEQIEYWLRLSLPQLITLHDLAFVLDVPDGLTVRSAQWEIVLVDGDFSGAEKNLSHVELGTGVTQVRGQAGVGVDDFPQPLSNNSGSDQEMLVKVLFTVDRSYTGGVPVIANNLFSLPASFSWSTGSDNTDPIPAFTVLEPDLTTLTKTRSAHLQADNATPAVSPGTGTYRNYNLIGPDNPASATDPVANIYQVRPGDIVEYTVTFRNDGSATAWDIQLRDTIPLGMTLRPGSVSIQTNPPDADVSISEPAPAPVVIFNINRVLPGHDVTVTYRCDVDTGVAAGRYLQNQAEIIQYSSLPAAPFVPPVMPVVAWPEADRSVTSGGTDQYTALGPVFEKVGTEYPTSSKTVAAEITAPAGKLKDGTSRATIGELMTYELRVDIPDTTVLYDFTFGDVLPDGLTVRNATYSINGGPAVALDAAAIPSGTTTVSATSNPFGDVAGQPGVTDEIVIVITATVDQSFVSATGATDNGPFGIGGANGVVDAGDVIANNASFTWNQVNDTATTLSQDVESTPVTFTILEPRLVNLTKAKAAVSPAAFAGPGDGYRNYNAVGPSPNNSGPVNDVDLAVPGHIVRYTLTLSNTGNTIAYDVDVTDTIPSGMSYVPGSASVAAGPQPSVIAFRNVPLAPVPPSQTITFELNQLEAGNTATIEYQLQVDVPAAAGRFLLNQANLTDYRSLPAATAAFPDAARDTAEPSPRYATLGPALAYLGTAFPTASKTVASEISLPAGKLADGSARGTIGEVMTYELLVDIPDDHILYDLLVEDVIPANLTVRSQNLVPADITFAVINNNGTVTTYGPAAPQLGIVGNTVGLYLESDVRAQNGVVNEIRVVIAVTIDDVAANVAGTVFANNVTTTWNQVDENPGTPGARGTVNSVVTPAPADEPDSVDFMVIEPALASGILTKTRSGHYLADGVSAAVSPGTASYRNYNPTGPVSHLGAQDPVPNVYQVRPTEILEFTATFTNSGDARAYDITLIDSVPAGFTLLAAGVNAPTLSGGSTVGIAFINGTPSQPGGSGTPISFVINWLDPGQTCTMTFRTQIQPGIGAGAYLQNQLAIVDFGTTPDATAVFPALERDTASLVPYTAPNPKYEKVGSEYPVTSKTIQTELTAPAGKLRDGSSRATIGELVTYEILLDIKDDLQLFDLSLNDLLPDGLTAVSATYSINGAAPVALTIAAQGNGTTQIIDTATPLGDVAAVAALDNEVVFTITATVDQSFISAIGASDNGPFGVGGANGIVDAGDIIGNNAAFTWNQLNDEASASTQNAEAAVVLLTIVEPTLNSSFSKDLIRVLDSDGNTNVTTTRGHTGTISAELVPAAAGGKASYFRYPLGGGNPTRVDDVQVVLPEDYVEFRITVTNSGNARAFDVKIRDVLPPVAAVDYVSGTGSFAVGAGPYDTGSAGSLLNVASSVVNVAGVDCTQLDFTIDMINPGDSVVILYRLRVLQGIGAGHYIGQNVADLLDYGTLPDGSFAVQVGNLPSGNTVYDNSRERDTASTPAYATQGPDGDDIGVQYPEFITRVYRRYDIEGVLTDTLLLDATNIRIGEVLIYELEAVLPRYTTLFDGGAAGNALAFRHRLNRGYHLLAGTEKLAGGDIDLTALLKVGSPPMPYPILETQQIPTWYFTDIANTAATAQRAQLRFQAEVRSSEYTGAAYFTDQTLSYSLAGRSYLFWNTIDAPEKNTLLAEAVLNTGDHPFLQRDGVATAVVQPNLQLFKNSNPAPDSFIGVSTGIGDTISYTLTLRNWDNAGAGPYRGRGTAYNVLVTDILPKDIAPSPPAEPLLTAAVHSINSGTGATGAVLRPLVLGSDYTYDYSFDSVTMQGTITVRTIRDVLNNDYASRIAANNALVIGYQVSVNPDIGAQGSGAGQRVNQALLDDYYSFPEGINDPNNKLYGPDGPQRTSLLTETPAITKSSANAGDSVVAGAVVEYAIVAPTPVIRANLYDIEIRDSIPNGLTFGGDGSIAGVGPGPVSLDLGDAPGQVPGSEVVVSGGSGAVTISISGRELVVTVERVDAEGGADQVTVSMRTLIKDSFDNGAPIARLHEFTNAASLLWYDDDSSFLERSRYATISGTVSHFYDARGILFEPSHTGTAQPGTIRSYRHILRNFEENDINVPLVFSSTQSSWVWQLFIGDGDGNMVDGPYATGHVVNVPANGLVEVIMRAFVPSEITSLTTDVLTITATGAVDNVIAVTDVTVTQAERVAVFKEVSTTGDYATRLNVQPSQGNAVNQRIRFVNTGPDDIKEVYIFDFIPEHTAYIANSAVNTAEFGLQYSKDGGVTWLAGEPADNGESVVNGTVPAVTNLRWYYNGGAALTPGNEHVITFQLRIK